MAESLGLNFDLIRVCVGNVSASTCLSAHVVPVEQLFTAVVAVNLNHY
jgi:hypothetical protein